jgi:hypothetical protein
MLAAMVGLAAIGMLVVAPLLWRILQDRRAERALAVRAVVHTAVVRALGGESLVSIDVQPPVLGRPGRVELSAPADWRVLLAPAWAAALSCVPAGWELVVTPPAVEHGLASDAMPARRAA